MVSSFTWDLDDSVIQDDIEYFFMKDYWRVNEAMMLLAGILPVQMEGLGSLLLSGRLLANAPDRDEIIDRAHKLKDLWNSNPENPEAASPAHYIEWAISKGYTPPWLRGAIKHGYYVPKQAQPIDECEHSGWQGFDIDAPDYPEELDIAFQAWTAARNGPNMIEPKKKIEEWLKKHYPKLGTAARDRIAKVANWKKIGGRPPARD